MRYPRITVITPSYNQAAYLERTITSVLDQGYSNLEYIVIDGGSTDGSVEIIKKYQRRLAYWVSEADAGQAQAINKGLKRATGEWVAWQNSDDCYCPDAFRSFAHAADANSDIHLIIGNMMLVDENGREIRDIRYVRPTYRALLAEGMVLANQAAFWRRSVHTEIGFLNENLNCIFDYEWFLRITHRYRAAHVNAIWGALRLHADTKTSQLQSVFQKEYQAVLAGREIGGLGKRLYQLRRLTLLLRQRSFKYVARGLWRRFRGVSELPP